MQIYDSAWPVSWSADMIPKELETPLVGSGGQTLPNPIKCNDDDTENFVKEDPEEIFGDAAGGSPRVCMPSNTPSLRHEHQPSIQLCDCPSGTVQMVGQDNDFGCDGQTLPTNCPENNQVKFWRSKEKFQKKGVLKRKVLKKRGGLQQETEAKEE